MKLRVSRAKARRDWIKAQRIGWEIEHQKTIHAHVVAFLLDSFEETSRLDPRESVLRRREATPVEKSLA
jgi:hypothetical protein